MLKIDLYVELLPIINTREPPQEFKQISGHKGKLLDVRQWHFYDIHDIPDVRFDVVECGSKRVGAARIGDQVGNMPMNKCWWLNKDNERMDQIKAVQTFSNNLSTIKYPPSDEIQCILKILKSWIPTDNENSEKSNGKKFCVSEFLNSNYMANFQFPDGASKSSRAEEAKYFQRKWS